MELLQLLSQEDLEQMQERFGDDGLEIDEFVSTFTNFLQHKVDIGEAGEEVLLRWSPASTSNLFREVDYNGDGSVDWQEFTSFAISVAFANSNSATARKDENFKDYLPTDITIENQSKQLKQLVYIPGCERLVACGFTKTTVHDTNGAAIKDGHLKMEGNLLDATYLPHLSLMVTSSDANYIHFFDTLDKYSCRKRLIAERAMTKWIHPVNSGPLGAMKLVGGDREGYVHLLGLDKMRSNVASIGTNLKHITLSKRPLHTDCITSLHFVEHSARNSLLSSSLDNSIRLSDPETGVKTLDLACGHEEYVRQVSVSNLHRIYVACGGETYATAASLDHKQRTPFFLKDVRLPHVHNLVGVHAVPNTHQIITADSGGTMKLWDARQFQCVTTFQLPKGENTNTSSIMGKSAALKAKSLGTTNVMNSLVYINPKKTFAAVGRDTLVYTYDKRQTAKTAHTDPIVALIYVLQTHSIITATAKEIRVWSVMSGMCVAHFMELELELMEEITCVSVDPVSGRRIFIGTSAGWFACLLPTTGKEIWRHSIVVAHDPIGDAIMAEDDMVPQAGAGKDTAFIAASSAGHAVEDEEAHDPTIKEKKKQNPDSFAAKYRYNKIVFVHMVDRRSFIVGSAAGEVFMWLEDDLFPQTRIYPPEEKEANNDVLNVSPDEAFEVSKKKRKEYDKNLNPIGVNCFSLISGLFLFTLDTGNKLMLMEIKARSITQPNDEGYGPQTEISSVAFVKEAATGNELSVFAVGDAFGAVALWTVRNKNIFGAPTQHLATVRTPKHVAAASLCGVQDRYLVAGLSKSMLTVWDLKDVMDALTHYVTPEGGKARSSIAPETDTLGARLMKVAQRHDAIHHQKKMSLSGSTSASPLSASGLALNSIAGESLEEASLKKIEEKLQEGAEVERVFFCSPDQEFIGFLSSVGNTGLFAAATVEEDALVRIFSADGEDCGLLCQGREPESEGISPVTDPSNMNLTRRGSFFNPSLSTLGTYRVKKVLNTRRPITKAASSAKMKSSRKKSTTWTVKEDGVLGSESPTSEPSSPVITTEDGSISFPQPEEEDAAVLPPINIDLKRAKGPELGLQELNRIRRKKRRHRVKHSGKQHINVEEFDADTPKIVQDLLDVENAHKQRIMNRTASTAGPASRGSMAVSNAPGSPQDVLGVSTRRKWHRHNMPIEDENEEDKIEVVKEEFPLPKHRAKPRGATELPIIHKTTTTLPLIPNHKQQLPDGRRFVSGAEMLTAHGSQQRQAQEQGEVSLRGAQQATKQEMSRQAKQARSDRLKRKEMESSPAARRFYTTAKMSMHFLTKLKTGANNASEKIPLPPSDQQQPPQGPQSARQPRTKPFSEFAKGLLANARKGTGDVNTTTDGLASSVESRGVQMILAQEDDNSTLEGFGIPQVPQPPPGKQSSGGLRSRIGDGGKPNPMDSISSSLGFLEGIVKVSSATLQPLEHTNLSRSGPRVGEDGLLANQSQK